MVARPRCKLCGKQHWSGEPHDWGAIEKLAETREKAGAHVEARVLKMAAEGKGVKEMQDRIAALEEQVAWLKSENQDRSDAQNYADDLMWALLKRLFGLSEDDDYPTVEFIGSAPLVNASPAAAQQEASQPAETDRKAYMREYQKRRRQEATKRRLADVEF